MTEPSVYDYLDYRRFLEDWLHWKGTQRASYSHGVFAKKAGLGRSTLANVLAGRREPSEDSLDGFARAMQLDDEARAYLGQLVRLQRATNLDEHAALLRELFDHPRYGGGQRVDIAQLDGLTSWHALAIHELATLPGFRPDPEWIAARLTPEVNPEDVARTLDEMRAAGLLDDPPVHRLHTPPLAIHLGAWRAHQSALDAAKEALVQVPRDDRGFHLATVSVPRASVPALLAEVEAMVTRLRELADGYREESEAVVQINVQAWMVGEVGREDGDTSTD